MTLYECEFLYIYILSFIFLSLKMNVYCLILPKNLVYMGFFRSMLQMHVVLSF